VRTPEAPRQLMTLKIGYLDGRGHPHVKIRVWGLSEQFAQEFEAMIDTGFTGFLSIPITAAFPLAITLFGTTSYMLADGSTSPKLLGFGTVALEDETAHGTIVLESKSSGLLLGMEFLQKLKKALVVGSNGVVLVDDHVIPMPPAPAPAPLPPTSPPLPPLTRPSDEDPQNKSK
jgi:predicted aspartyl protease